MTQQERIGQAAIKAHIELEESGRLLFYNIFQKGVEWALSNQWISIDEELPEEDTINKGYSIPVFVIGGHHKPQSAIYSYKDKKFISCGIFLSSTHWMHIPSI